MKIKLSQPLKDFKGETIKRNGEDLVLRDVLVGGLLCEFDSTGKQRLRDVTPAEKIRIWEIGPLLTNEEEVELKSDDLVFIKEGIDKLYNGLIYGQVVEMIEPKENPPVKEPKS